MLIEVVDYDADWTKRFSEESDKILSVLPEGFATLHHVGSTSIPGLAAKPVTDMLLEVEDLNQLDRLSRRLENLGYHAKGEFGIPERRFFLKEPINRTHHIHTFVTDSYGAERHLAVRDYLRNHSKDAADYAALKKRNALAHPHDMDAYCDAKHDFVQELERTALEWSRRQ